MKNRKNMRTHSGFNLVEAAIVLGVVGLVIGGIWVAASTLRQNMLVNQTASAIQTIVSEANKIYTNMPRPAAATNLTPLMIQSGAIPSDLVMGTTAKTPWGTSLAVQYRVLPNKLQVYLQNLPKNLCYQLMNRLLANTDTSSGIGPQGLDIIYFPSAGNIVVGQTQAMIANTCDSDHTGWTWLEFQFPAPR